MSTGAAGIEGYPPIVTHGTVRTHTTGEVALEGQAPIVAIGPAPAPMTEQEKYERMWQEPVYRKVAPGQLCAMEFLRQARPAEGSTVIDFGCGTGRGAAALAALGHLRVHMLDFAANCLDPAIAEHTLRLPLTPECSVNPEMMALVFQQHDLTQPSPVQAEYGFCTDVMEHIPPEDVNKVLTTVLMAARHVFFQISTVDDVCGALIGQPLHLSVHPYDWWLQKLQSLDCAVHWSVDKSDHCLFYVSAWRDGQELVDIGVLNETDEQIKANVLANTKDNKWKQVRPHEQNEEQVMLVGGGPSLPGQLEEIRRLRAEGVKLVCLNGAHQWAIDNGLVPSAVVVVDARPFNARFTHPVSETSLYFLASQCAPEVYEGLPVERTYQWHAAAGLVGDIVSEHIPEAYFVPGGSTVLLRAILLMRMLGYHWFHFFGCDSCLVPDEDSVTLVNEEVVRKHNYFHHAYAQPENDEKVVLPVTLGGRVFHCHPWMVAQAQEFISLIKIFGSEFELIVHGDGLLAHIVETGASQSIELT
jgi:SAM-dependent methyltransferase